MKFSRFVTLSFLLTAGWAFSCASGTDASNRGASGPAPASTTPRDPTVDAVSLGGKAGGPASNLNPLCGAVVQCNPDSLTACDAFMPPTGSGGVASSTGGAPSALGGAPASTGGAGASAGYLSSGGTQTGRAGAAGQAGAAEAGAAGFESQAGSTSMSGGAISNAASSLSGGSGQVVPPTFDGTPTTPSYACRVSSANGSGNGVVAACGLAGSGVVDDPCSGSRDCAPGLGCVGEGVLARCRPFCCAGNELCAPGSYCATRPLREPTAGVAPALLVPVCVSADNCDLGEPSPCPATRTCTCAAGTSCSVVRADGTTSCVVPGKGLASDACPCAAGYLCSQGSGTCLKLCRTTDLNAGCGLGRCQSSAGLPANYGVCVGLPTGGGGAAGNAGVMNL